MQPAVETFRYRVVYPGGVFIRVSPSSDSEKTGEVLEFGAVFDASKSIVSEGTNYAKLMDGSGWVIGNKGSTEILELVKVTRVVPPDVLSGSGASTLPLNDALIENPSRIPGMPRSLRSVELMLAPPSATDASLSRVERTTRTFHTARNENRFWRDLRTKVCDCRSFEDFAQLAQTHSKALPPLIPEAGGASGWMSDTKSEQQIRFNIHSISAVTKQTIGTIDVSGLETSMWLYVHLGSKVSHTALQLVVDAANKRLEMVSTDVQSNLIHLVDYIGSLARSHCIELGKRVDILSEEIRSYLQRWVLVQMIDIELKDEMAAITAQSTGASAYASLSPSDAIRTPTSSGCTSSSSASWVSKLVCSGDIEDTNASHTECDELDRDPAEEKKDHTFVQKWWEAIEQRVSWLSNPDVQFASLI